MSPHISEAIAPIRGLITPTPRGTPRTKRAGYDSITIRLPHRVAGVPRWQWVRVDIAGPRSGRVDKIRLPWLDTIAG